MRGTEVNIIWVDMEQKLMFVGATSHAGLVDHLFAVTLDGVHCKRYIAEATNTSEICVIAKFGYEGEDDTVSGLYAMRQYRKVQKDVMAYIEEQARMAS